MRNSSLIAHRSSLISTPKFSLIGAAGYIAPRHLKAIREVKGVLLAACDPNDSVGVLDSYFPNAAFFTEFERFDRHLERLKRQGDKPDYLSICSPNYLHDAHARYALRYGADALCEKPLVLNPWNLDALAEMEQESGRRVWNLLQLRHHPKVLEIKKMVEEAPENQVFDLDLTYITPRGQWYYASWKGDEAKSGGITVNIGIHLLDMLLWVFGPLQSLKVHRRTQGRAAGYLELQKARVRWFLSIEAETLPANAPDRNSPFRALQYADQSWNFSEGFSDLHTTAYQEILDGRGFGIEDCRPAIELAYRIRQAPIQEIDESAHALARLPERAHPFSNAE
ncbi:MAG: Gfo/Idh/MocA family oxidoreductase [Chitinophagales bacterium]|nr:Gfo/Idh/MocA family oxidoreductase [Chitinophagales bacterium]